MRSKALAQVVVAVAGILLCTLPALAAAQEHVEAVWAHRHITYIYQGFTTQYSCSGLRDKIRYMLKKLGAHDLKVHSYGCVRLTGPEVAPGVKVTMRVLVPASSGHGHIGHTVAAHWHDVVLLAGNADHEEQGNCELIQQFKRQFLPLFATRNIRFSATCIPHQITLGNHLSAEVLMPNVTTRAASR